MTAEIIYEGNLRTEATHLNSKSQITTDAPLDNNGKGEKFSPTDLVATALGQCALTIMGMAANTQGIKIEGSSCKIEKIMGTQPRRIVAINAVFEMKGQADFSEKEQKILENSALTCPVFFSLHPEIEKNISFIWS